MARMAVAAAVLTAAFALAPVSAGATPFSNTPAQPAAAPGSENVVKVQRGPRGGAGPRRFYGRPYARRGGAGWGYGAWARRPYYGTVFAGVALGTIIGVTAYGLAPRPPHPDLCWYWDDDRGRRGFWDYCPRD